MCKFAKVETLSFWKKYWPRALVVDKISAAMLLEGFCGLVGESSPPIRLQTDHLVQVTHLATP
jgi:L-rhamnose isomerase